VLLSFVGEEGDDGGVHPLVKKEKFNAALIDADTGLVNKGEGNVGSNFVSMPTEASMDTSKKAQVVDKKAEMTKRRKQSASKSPVPPMKQPSPAMQLPLPNDEEPLRSPSMSPESADVGKMNTLLDKTNAQIAEMKASMKRNIQTALTTDTKLKSALEQMIPATAVRGRKRKHGINGDAGSDKQTLNLLSAFRSKLESAPPEIEVSTSPTQDSGRQLKVENGHQQHAEDKDEEAKLCDLHFIANCQSCISWDQHLSGDVETKADDDTGWMSHALSFEKDRLGKDLAWKKKNEEELVIIDPREKEKGIKEEQRAKKKARMGMHVPLP
ncbi:MAG: hypothetical protein Q9164_003504, partial [Protoblastenia rupestris]